MRYRYAGVIAINPNTDRAEVVKSATGTVHINEDWATPVVVQDPNGFDMTTLNTTVEGLFPDFYVEDQPVVGFKTSSGHRFYLRSSTPVPGPAGPIPLAVNALEGSLMFEYGDGTTVPGPPLPTPATLADENVADLVQDPNTATGASVQAAALAASVDPLRWQTSRAVDITSKPRLDDVPTLTWTQSYATTLTSPVEYKPKGVGGGAKVTGWNGQDDPTFAFFPGSYHTGFGGAEDLALFGEIKPGGASQAAGWPLIFSFVTSATDTVEIAYQGGVTNLVVMIEVNGRLVDDAGSWTPGTITGSNCTLKLKFPTAKSRNIRIWGMHNPGIVAVRVPTGQSLTKPSVPSRVAAFIGDSFVNGSGVSHSYPDQGAWTVETFAPRLLRMLGYDRMLLAGIGGTGWTTANPYADRIPVALSTNPELLVFFGSVNDGSTNTGVKAAVASALASVSTVPKVVVIPPVVAGDAFESTTQQMREATLEAGRTFIDTGVFFTGTGKVGTPTGDGNRDYFIRPDGVHPTLDGHRAFARFLFELMA